MLLTLLIGILFWPIYVIVWAITVMLNWCSYTVFAKPVKLVKYEESAYVYSIWYRYRSLGKSFSSQKEDFCYIFERLHHPEVILKDSVTLFTVTPEEAVFVDCGDIDVFDSCTNTYMYTAQYKSAKKLIILPISSFHKVAQQIPVPNVPLIHLANHGRCGSTLVTKVFNAIPGSITMSEPAAFTRLSHLSKAGTVDRATLKCLIHSTLLCTIKHGNTRDCSMLFFKPQSPTIFITDLLMEAVPHVNHIFMYRQPVPFVRSYEKLLFFFRSSSGFKDVANFSGGRGCHKLMEDYPKCPEEDIQNLSPFSILSMVWIDSVAAFMKLIEKGYKIRSLKYERFLENPENVLKTLLSCINISESYSPSNLESILSKDSQAGTLLTSHSVGTEKLKRLIQITPKLKNEVDKICQDFNVPSFWDDVNLVNDITD